MIYAFYDGDGVGRRFAALYEANDIEGACRLSQRILQAHRATEGACRGLGASLIECGGDEGMIRCGEASPLKVGEAAWRAWQDQGLDATVGIGDSPSQAYRNCQALKAQKASAVSLSAPRPMAESAASATRPQTSPPKPASSSSSAKSTSTSSGFISTIETSISLTKGYLALLAGQWQAFERSRSALPSARRARIRESLAILSESLDLIWSAESALTGLQGSSTPCQDGWALLPTDGPLEKPRPSAPERPGSRPQGFPNFPPEPRS